MIQFKQGQRLVIPVEVVHEPAEPGSSGSDVGVRSTCAGTYLGRFMPSVFQLPDIVAATESDGIALAAAQAQIRMLEEQIRQISNQAIEHALIALRIKAELEARNAIEHSSGT